MDGERVLKHVPVSMSHDRGGNGTDRPVTLGDLQTLTHTIERADDRTQTLIEVNNTQWQAISENQRARVDAEKRLRRIEEALNLPTP